jgi:triphosphoribosyl-dephospho-CoA synthase
VSRTLSSTEIAVLAQAACLVEASAPKPGNVSPGRDFADTRYEDFLLSASAIGPAFARAPVAGVGETVLQAVHDTRRFVRANTNLGLVLLLAPLACAAGKQGGSLRERLARVLAALSLADAQAVHAAIRLVNPGGLGTAEAEDVRGEPTRTLRETMALAAGRDSIAREYVSDYDATFGLVAPALGRARARGLGWPDAVLEAYLCTLAELPDTLIARKASLEAARAVSARAREVLAAGEVGSAERARAEAAFDRELRREGNRLNPGTTADLVAAGLFVALSEEL